MVKAIVFDCFGVVISDGFEESYRRMGGDPEKDHEFIKQVMHDSNSGKIPSSTSAIAKHLGVSNEVWYEANNGSRVVNWPLLDYVLKLRKSYKVAMLSNIGSGGVRRFFEPGLLEKYFDPIVESGVIGYAKPEARAYEITADKLGVRCDGCVFIDDRQEYVDGAIAVGMRAILYKNLPKLKRDLESTLE